MIQRLALLTLSLLLLPTLALADSHEGIVAEVEKAIEDGLAFSREHKAGAPDGISKDGSVEFWSSGGLANRVSPGGDPQEFEIFNLQAKHIEVIPLGDAAAVAIYYTEGSLQPKGHPVVADYRTRVMAILVKEDGQWKQRAGHWSPLVGGSGTSQTVE